MKKEAYPGKKLSGIVLSTFLALCIMVNFTGCEKDPVEPVIPPATLQADVKANHDTIPKGEIVTFTITSNADSVVAVIISNGQRRKLTSGNEQFILYESTKIDFRFYKGIDTKTITVSISVTIPPISLLDGIVKYPWGKTSAMRKCSENDPWQDTPIPPPDLIVKWVFSKDGKFGIYRYGVLLYDLRDFSITESDSILSLGDYRYKIVYLVDTNLSLERQNDIFSSDCDDGLSFALYNFIADTLKK